MDSRPTHPDSTGTAQNAQLSSPALIRIRMECPDLSAAPRHPLPAPFTLRCFQPGDVETWIRIESAADRHQVITPTLYERQFGRDLSILAQRQLFLCDGNREAIGTATAWFDPTDRKQNWGRVHWVAIVPPWQGHQLAKPLLSAVCERLCTLGHQRAFLMTETVRTAAISLYRQFGFVETS